MHSFKGEWGIAILERPKSTSFNVALSESSVSIMFSGLRSLWITPTEWRAAKPLEIWPMKSRMMLSVSLKSLFQWSRTGLLQGGILESNRMPFCLQTIHKGWAHSCALALRESQFLSSESWCQHQFCSPSQPSLLPPFAQWLCWCHRTRPLEPLPQEFCQMSRNLLRSGTLIYPLAFEPIGPSLLCLRSKCSWPSCYWEEFEVGGISDSKLFLFCHCILYKYFSNYESHPLAQREQKILLKISDRSEFLTLWFSSRLA